MLIFTSGTSGDPKAVRITHEKVTFPGAYLVERLGLGRRRRVLRVDAAVPLQRRDGRLGTGAGRAAATVALAEKFSASGFLVRRPPLRRDVHELRGQAALLRAGHARSARRRGQPAAAGLRQRGRATATSPRSRERFGCHVVDGFGSTENAVVISRVPGTPPGSLGLPLEGVAVLDPETRAGVPAGRVRRRRSGGQPRRGDRRAGEHGRHRASSPGYYNDEAATAERMRGGMYWSGDLAYRDEAGFVYYAGRTADWLRVDGENLAASPIERILVRHPSIAEAAVYAVPDPSSGDQLVAALVLVGPLDPEGSRGVPGRPAGPRPEAVAAARPDPRRAPPHRDQQGAQARAPGRGLDDGERWNREERGTAYSPA